MKANPRAWGESAGNALIRQTPEDFVVTEVLGFEPGGEGEHAFLLLQKRQLNTQELAERLAALAGVPLRDIGFSGMKDRNAVTSQWFSVGLAGRAEPDWGLLEAAGDVVVLRSDRHQRKLRRGVHRANRFKLVLRNLDGAPDIIEERLRLIQQSGAPNYFGTQRFGRNGSTLRAATRWARSGGRVSRSKRGLYLSAIRGYLFNELLAQRVQEGSWNTVVSGQVCLLHGSNSYFVSAADDASIVPRLLQGDIHPALPLWGAGARATEAGFVESCGERLSEHADLCAFLEREGLQIAWRATRLLPHDFCWQFCDDGGLQLEFALGAGSFATALLAELVAVGDGSLVGGGSEC